MAKVYVSIGSNIDRSKNIRQCLEGLRERYGELLLSTTWKNAAVGFDGDAFYNLVAAFETTDLPEQVAHDCRVLETNQGRDRSAKRFSSRTLDIDILLYDDLVMDTDILQIPRHEITRYAFVLKPLAEIFPDGKHPVSGKTYQQMWQEFDSSNDDMTPVEEFPASY